MTIELMIFMASRMPNAQADYNVASFCAMPIAPSGLPSGILSQVCSRSRPIWLACGYGKYRRSESAHCIKLHHMTLGPGV
jgi:hypothetical protein